MESLKKIIIIKRFALIALWMICILISYAVRSQTQSTESGYSIRNDSVEFVFGEQKTIVIGQQVIVLKDRFHEIKKVNIAGDFNHWNPKDEKYVAVICPDKMFRLTVAKNQLGKKGETRQFKFVINRVYWVEPPRDAVNRFKGKDGNSNLTLKL